MFFSKRKYWSYETTHRISPDGFLPIDILHVDEGLKRAKQVKLEFANGIRFYVTQRAAQRYNVQATTPWEKSHTRSVGAEISVTVIEDPFRCDVSMPLLDRLNPACRPSSFLWGSDENRVHNLSAEELRSYANQANQYKHTPAWGRHNSLGLG